MRRTFMYPAHPGTDMTCSGTVSIALLRRRLLRRVEEELDGGGKRMPPLSSQFFLPRLIMLVGLGVTTMALYAVTHNLPHVVVHPADIGGAVGLTRSFWRVHESHLHSSSSCPLSFPSTHPITFLFKTGGPITAGFLGKDGTFSIR
jgi:hypothetical protein